ncbi:hypothetical protein ACFLXK_04465 [Chloroflexota bacterium]
MYKNLKDTLFWIFWCSTTISTGILAGFLTSHAIMFGRFQTWFIESGNVDLLHKTYTVFREASSPQVLYDSFFYLALVSGIIWTVLAFLIRKGRIIAMIAGLSTLWVSIVFFATRFGRAEDEVLTGIADAEMTQLFVTLNVPIHTCFAIFYIVSLFLLLVVALNNNRQLNKVSES